MNTIKSELTPLPERMRGLPIDKRGYPVPWFVPWVDGEPEFRAMDAQKFRDALKLNLCWVCGETLGKFKAFVLGPMCGITRTTSEPPNHLECAEWSAVNCPFLTQRETKRREDDFTRSCPVAGMQIKRQPGVTLIWVTRSFKVWRDDKGMPLLTVGEPESLSWWSHGRTATHAEIEESVRAGYPTLLEMANLDGPDAVAELERQRRWLEDRYPTSRMTIGELCG